MPIAVGSVCCMVNGWQQWPSFGHALSVRLRTLRKMRGLSQDRLAELSDVSRNQISNLERNENSVTKSADPTMSTVYRLARALHVPPAVLLPAATDIVQDICKDNAADLGVDLVWPAAPEDTLAFDIQHLYGLRMGENPRFVDPSGPKATPGDATG
ncbi:HTH-type transcriptional regulator [Corynebacterium pseudotuberculosis]|nr:HTH-type transcriptional regulator [Corynebacterium pseudotuberculosis 267]AJC13204.1 HTH-type transcriptional regulator [Corynebacterium pseudotuberculosis]AKJ55142.1 HTH-type transcriptional regulator [Corynebacterium pseudotuberculosis]AKP08145.1 HTH-type transcriptional regulator [Corynebacterium pseudotuberculosis]ALM77081.1 HTH-type transcriptional regulator [Corynebacterium pseudotuberculosis]